MVRLSLTEWESKAALLAHLDLFGGSSVVIGGAAESARRFYSCTVESPVGAVEVGVFSSGLGARPAAIVLDLGGMLIVGHDAWLTWLNLERRAVMAERRLGGVFFEFLPIDDEEVIVVHELGVLRADARGEETWSVDTDVIEEFQLDGSGGLVLSIMDAGHPVVVSIDSGAVRR